MSKVGVLQERGNSLVGMERFPPIKRSCLVGRGCFLMGRKEFLVGEGELSSVMCFGEERESSFVRKVGKGEFLIGREGLLWQ